MGNQKPGYAQSILPLRESTLTSAAQREGLSSLVLDQLRIPLLVLDENGVILKTNTAANALLRRLPRQLLIQDERLVIRGMAAGQFEHLLQSACGRLGPAQAGVALVNTGKKGCNSKHHKLQCLVLPFLAQPLECAPSPQPLALVLLRQFDPQYRLRPNPQLMRQLFGLTLAETNVALGLCQGETPTEIAQRLAVSIRTVRAHLSAVLAKTNTTRQTDLLRLLSILSIVDGR
jgi:DNA-binding CsgD family transcriptional regulator